MGGLGYIVEIERYPDEEEAETPLVELHRQVWDHLEATIREHCTSDASRQMITYYLSHEVYEGFHRPLGQGWWRSETDLHFSWGDGHGGCRMSYRAGYHWTKMAYAHRWAHILMEVQGWRVKPPMWTCATQLVLGPRDPLVHLRDGLFTVHRREPGRAEDEAAYSDSVSIAWSELAGDERDVVEWIALTGECLCDLCAYLRTVNNLAPSNPKAHVEAARATWAELETGAHAALVAAAGKAVVAWNWQQDGEPPELRALSAALGPKLWLRALAGMVYGRTRT